MKVYRAARSFSQQVGQQLERGGVYAPHLISITKYALSKWYSINLSDDQWVIIAPLTSSRKPDRQLRITDMRAVFNADWLLSARARCQWHLLPRDYRAFWTVYGYFQAWQRGGAWQAIHDRLRGDLRGLLGRRLSKDFEARPQTSEAWIRIAMIQFMTRHLAALAT